MKTKEPGIAAALNIVPGLGYLYINKKRVLGWMLLTVVALSVATMFEPSFIDYAEVPVTPVWDAIYQASFLLTFATFIVDGYIEAKRHNALLDAKKSSPKL